VKENKATVRTCKRDGYPGLVEGGGVSPSQEMGLEKLTKKGGGREEKYGLTRSSDL